MYTDWKVFFTQFIPHEEYIPDNISSNNANVLLFFLFLGFIASFGLTAKVENHTGALKSQDPISQKIQKVQKELNLAESQNANLESELIIINHSITQALTNKQNKEILKLAKLAGLHKETGKGIIIQIKDNEKPLQADETPGNGIIHNTDLVSIINEMWAAGATAVSINNKRITAGSQISCIGPTILINKERVVPPFVIKALGEQEKLFNKLNKGYVQNLGTNGIKYIIEKYNGIEIPADGNIILAGEN